MLTIRQAQLQVFDAAARERLGRDVIHGLQAELPHTVQGLAPTEIDERLQTALALAEQHGLVAARDLRAFLRLGFVVGPRFADHAPVRALLRQAAQQQGDRLGPLFAAMQAADWQRAAEHDIVSRALDARPAVKPVGCAGAGVQGFIAAALPCVCLEPLAPAHADDYLHHALHPDVWRLARLRPRTSREDVLSHIRHCSTGPGRQAHAIVGADGRCMGAITLRTEPAAAGLALAHVAYWVARPAWGMGLATHALGQLRSLLRRHARIQRLRAEIAGTNRLSIRLVERLGWTELPPAQARSVHRVFEIQV